MRVSSSSAVRSKAGYEARFVGPSSAGSGMLQCTSSGWDGNSGHTSRTRSHSVITSSKRCGDELVEVLGAVRADVDPALRAARGPRSGCSGFGWLPALAASIAPADMCSSSASAIWDRALLPVHRNNTRRRRREPPRRARAGDAGARRRAGCSAPPAALQRFAAGDEVDGVVAVAAVRRAAASGHEAAVAEMAQVVRHQALRLVDQRHQLRHGPIAAHQLLQQPPTHRVRRQSHERRRVTDRGTSGDARLHAANTTGRGA